MIHLEEINVIEAPIERCFDLSRGFLRAIREAWGTRIGLPTTSWMIEIGTFLMRTESELILKSRQVVPGRLLAAGFQFIYPHWLKAAKDLVLRWRSRNFTI